MLHCLIEKPLWTFWFYIYIKVNCGKLQIMAIWSQPHNTQENRQHRGKESLSYSHIYSLISATISKWFSLFTSNGSEISRLWNSAELFTSRPSFFPPRFVFTGHSDNSDVFPLDVPLHCSRQAAPNNFEPVCSLQSGPDLRGMQWIIIPCLCSPPRLSPPPPSRPPSFNVQRDLKWRCKGQ